MQRKRTVQTKNGDRRAISQVDSRCRHTGFLAVVHYLIAKYNKRKNSPYYRDFTTHMVVITQTTRDP